MASQYLARLGIVLGVDSGELVTKLTEAQKQFDNLAKEGKRATNAAAKEIMALTHATEDYGRTLTKVEQIEREIKTGRFMNAEQNTLNILRAQAKAYDEKVASARKMTGVLSEQQKMAVTYQVTDFFTQIASGQNAMIAFIQQGGQLKDQMGGIGAAFRALATVFTPFRIAVGGAAAAIGAIGYAVYQADREMATFKDSMTLTGQYAGIAYAEFIKLGDALSQKVNVSIGETRDVMQALVGSGAFTRDSINSVGRAVLNFAKLTGTDAKEAAKQFIPLLDGTAASAKSLNDKYHFLTLEQYKYIEALEKQGKLQEAAKVTADALSASFEKTTRNLGTLEKMWKDLKDAASAAWDAMLGFGREPGIDRAKELEKKINEIETEITRRKSLGLKTGSQEAAIKAMQTELNSIVQRVGAEMDAAQAAAKEAEKNTKNINEYAQDKETLIKKAEELAKAQADAKYFVAVQNVNDIERLDQEVMKRIMEARLVMEKDNAKEFNRFASQNMATYTAKVTGILADGSEKLRQIFSKDKIALQKGMEEVRIEAESWDKMYDEQYIAAENIAKAQTKQLESQRDILKIRQESFLMTEKEQALALVADKYRKLRFEAQYRPERERDMLFQQYDYQEQLEKMNIDVQMSLKKTQNVFDTIFSEMSRSIDTFVQSGKFAFRDFSASIIRSMLAMEMKLQAMSFLKSIFGMFRYQQQINATGVPNQFNPPIDYRADGGPVSGGAPYVVGERGPELFVPRSAGTIIPNDRMSSGGSVTNITNNYIDAIDVQSFEQRLLGSSNAVWAANQYANKSLAVGRGRA